MIGLTVNITGAGQVQATLRRIEDARYGAALASIGLTLVSQSKDNIDKHTGPAGAWPRSSLSELFAGPRIWGDIKAAVHSDVLGQTVRIGVAHIAGAVRQLGTVGAGGSLPDIVPVNKKALTIPVSQAASRASYAGIDARTAFPKSFIKPVPPGQSAQNVAVICREINPRKEKDGRAKGKQIEILYLLVKKVAIRPHPFLPITASGELAPASLWATINEMLVGTFLNTT
jgi:hypothetical protein